MDRKQVRMYYISLKHFISDRVLYRNVKSYTRILDFLVLNLKPIPAAFKEYPAFKYLRTGGRILRACLITFCVVNTAKTVGGYPACIFGKSMQPEFNSVTGWKEREDALSSWKSSYLRLDLDWVWVSGWRARDLSFSRGDIVVFVSPKEPYDYVIKRVIGLEGDVVTSHHEHERVRVHIPEGHCWVEGDNWNNTIDSNKYGPISKGLIFGVATHVIWPTHKWRRLMSGVPSDLEPDRVEVAGGQPRSRSWLQSLKILLYFVKS